MNEPLVSVLMTTYNRQRFVAEAIESVLASSYANFELIIVDDCSTDDTVKIVERYAEADDRIRLYVNEKNLGDYPNRNQAASYAKGKYLKYVDADDYIYPWGLTLIIESMEKFPEAGWALCSIDQDAVRPFPFVLRPAEAYEYNFKSFPIFSRAPLSAAFRRDVFKSVEGFNAIRMAGDYDMWLRLGQQFPVVLLPHGIIWSRVHDSQEMNAHDHFRYLYERLKIKHLSSDRCPLARHESRAILRRERQRLRRLLVKQLLARRFRSARTVLAMLAEYAKTCR